MNAAFGATAKERNKPVFRAVGTKAAPKLRLEGVLTLPTMITIL
jgi:hypothetical protein